MTFVIPVRGWDSFDALHVDVTEYIKSAGLEQQNDARRKLNRFPRRYFTIALRELFRNYYFGELTLTNAFTDTRV